MFDIQVKTQSDLADLFNVSARQIREWKSQGCPIEPGEYFVGRVVRWLQSQLAAGRRFKGWNLGADENAPPSTDELINRQKLRRLELETAEAEQRLVPRDLVRASMTRIIAILQRCQKQIERQFGRAAVEILDDALNDCSIEVVGGLEQLALQSEE